jgi:hypothetical protein
MTLGDDTAEAQPGARVHMPAGLRHAAKAQILRIVPDRAVMSCRQLTR